MIKKAVSVIIPTLNEQANISQLVSRLDKTLTQAGIAYEVIIIDDHSSDATIQHAKEMAGTKPVRVFLKQGKKGKAFSILEGVAKAKFDYVGMIDADLQYPPESLPEMVELTQKYDVVVANRTKRHTNLLRTTISNIYRKMFTKWFLGYQIDLQSGMKVFKKEIFNYVDLRPTAWTFDLELLEAAKHMGYKIGGVDIEFRDRERGLSKVNVLKTSWEIGTHALKTKFREPQAIQVDKTTLDKGLFFNGKKYMPYNNLPLKDTALRTLTNHQLLVMIVLAVSLAILLFLDWKTTLIILFGILTVVYFADMLYYFYLSVRSLRMYPEIQVASEEIAQLKDDELPIYTIFCPLYKEWEVLEQFTDAMSKLNYPKDKLQVMLLLEEDDQETVEKARSYNLPEYFEIVVTPDAKPKTKPKACNYGLKFARGEHVVIYDAEDVPDPDQLKIAILAFAKVPSNTICIQAKLNFYNTSQNLLTRLFTAEYSLWFDLILTGLQSVNAPLPLGGTSNHFKTQALRNIEGWDAFNVTEDCDLGMRLAKHGMLTAIVDSVTLEEANSEWGNWIKQRSRWIKGYLQTWLIHMRSLKGFKSGHATAFMLIVGGKTFAMFMNPIMWLVTILYFMARSVVGPIVDDFYPGPILYMGVISLIFGNFLYMYYYMIGCAKREQWDVIPFVFLVPIYWLMMSAAAWLALYKLITAPHHWYKTKHGLHLKQNASPVVQPVSAIVQT